MTLILDFRLASVENDGSTLSIVGKNSEGEEIRLSTIAEILGATGQRPDYSIAAELRLELDPWLESTKALGPLIDPNVHSCGTVHPHGHRELSHPESGFYTVGVKSSDVSDGDRIRTGPVDLCRSRRRHGGRRSSAIRSA